eukprot:3940303-Rhodomonas_salina.6
MLLAMCLGVGDTSAGTNRVSRSLKQVATAFAVRPCTSLRACYAMPGTDLAYRYLFACARAAPCPALS